MKEDYRAGGSSPDAEDSHGLDDDDEEEHHLGSRKLSLDGSFLDDQDNPEGNSNNGLPKTIAVKGTSPMTNPASQKLFGIKE